MTIVLCPEGLPEITIRRDSSKTAWATAWDDIGELLTFNGKKSLNGRWVFESKDLVHTDKFTCSNDFSQLTYFDSYSRYKFSL